MSAFYTGFKAMDRLEAFYSAHSYSGIGSIWTPLGPYFFDLAELDPYSLCCELKNEFGVGWGTICKWIENVSDDRIH